MNITRYVLVKPEVRLDFLGGVYVELKPRNKAYTDLNHARGARTQLRNPNLLIAKLKFDEFVA